MSTSRKIKKPQDSNYISKLEEMPAAEVLVMFFMLSSVVIFFFSMLSYELYATQESLTTGNFNLPGFISLGAVIILISLPLSFKLLPAYQNDNFHQLKKTLLLMLSAGIAFSIIQLLAGQQLLKYEETIPFSTKTSYLHLFIGLHLMHLVVNLIFGFVIFFQVDKASHEPVAGLLFLTNPIKKLNIRIFALTYQYIAFLWAFLFVYIMFRF